MTNNKGFTLLELMLSVMIIGILAAIALPSYMDYIIRAQVAEAMTISSEAKTNVNEFYAFTGRMPANNEEAGMAKPSSYRGNYIKAITVENGSIHLDFDISNMETKSLSLQPFSNPHDLTADLVWSCSKNKEIEGLVEHGVNKTNLEDKYLPAICRSKYRRKN